MGVPGALRRGRVPGKSIVENVHDPFRGEERQLSANTWNQIRCALKFLYEVTLRRQ